MFRVEQHDMKANESNKPDSRDCGFSNGLLSSAIAASMSSLNFGWCLGEPNIPEAIIKDCVEGQGIMINGLPTCLPMSKPVWGLVVGIVAFGALVGSLVAGKAADRYGRKTVLTVNNIFYIVGALLLATATSVAQLAIGRFIAGLGCGISSTVVATYNYECAPQRLKGFIGVILQLSVEVGVFLSQIAAVGLVTIPNWRILFGLSGAISLIQLMWLPFMPESPQYLLRQGNVAAATHALQRLRPNHDVTSEIIEMSEACQYDLIGTSNCLSQGGMPMQKRVYVDKCNIIDKVEIKDVSIYTNNNSIAAIRTANIGIVDIAKGKTPDVIWHLIFSTMFLMGFQQWTGAKGVVFYSTEILIRALHLSESQVQRTPNKAQWTTIGLAGAGIIAVVISMNLIDRLGRRLLLMVSTSGLCLSCLCIVIGTIHNIPALALPSMFAFKIFYGLGMAPIPWLTASEMLPYYALGALSGLASALNWMMIFIIGLVFPVVSKALGDFLFMPFAALNFMAFIVVLLFIPETKNQSISEILLCHGKSIHCVFHLPKAKKTNQTHI